MKVNKDLLEAYVIVQSSNFKDELAKLGDFTFIKVNYRKQPSIEIHKDKNVEYHVFLEANFNFNEEYSEKIEQQTYEQARTFISKYFEDKGNEILKKLDFPGKVTTKPVDKKAVSDIKWEGKISFEGDLSNNAAYKDMFTEEALQESKVAKKTETESLFLESFQGFYNQILGESSEKTASEFGDVISEIKSYLAKARDLIIENELDKNEACKQALNKITEARRIISLEK